MRNRFWTPEEDRMLKRMAGEYLTKDIANYLERTYSSVNMRAHRLGVRMQIYGEKHSHSKYSNAQVEQARELFFDKGKTIREISEITKINREYTKKLVNFVSRTHDPIRT